MQKVIDQNYLREPNPQLHEYLKAGNDVVFTDYAGMESHKGNALTNLTRSLEIVSKYPGRVLVLKPTSDVIQLTRYGLANLPQALVDSQQTEGFPAYCNQLFMIRPNKLSRPLAYIEKLSREANEFFKERLTYAEMIVKSIEARATELHPDHMKTLRTGALWGVDLLSVMIGQIVDITAIQMGKMGFSPLTGRKPLAFRRRLQQACVGVFQGIAKPPPQAGFFDDTGNHVAIAGMSSYALRGRRHQSASADEHKTRRLQSAVV